MHQGKLILILTCLYRMLPLTWLKQRASVMLLTVFQHFFSVGEVSREAGFTVTVCRTNFCDEAVHVEGRYHDDLQSVHENKRCKKEAKQIE